MSEHHENNFENIIELLIMPAVAVLEALEISGDRAGKVRDAFAGMTEMLAFVALPFLIPFMEIGAGGKSES